MALPLLPLPMPLRADYGNPPSLDRAIDLVERISAGQEAFVGDGALPGGCILTIVSGYTARVPSGAKFWSEGQYLSLAANQDYTAAVAGSTVHLWARITVTRAAKTDPTAEDVYALDITHNTTGIAPADAASGGSYFALAILTTDGVGITAIAEPVAKYVRSAIGPFGAMRDYIHTSETTVTIPAYHQLALYDSVTVDGSLMVEGVLRVLAEPSA